jgi:sugar/nucleoside kinase (ribokinase family)
MRNRTDILNMNGWSMNKNYTLAAIGTAYIDIQAPVSVDFLDRFKLPIGSGAAASFATLNDIIRHLDAPLFLPGGPSANTAAGVAAFGHPVKFFGKVAEDSAGKVFVQDLIARGIDAGCEIIVPSATNSPLCAVLITPNGERTFAWNSGCADAFSSQDFVDFDFTQTRFLLAEHFLIPQSPCLLDALQRAAAAGCTTIINMQGFTTEDADPEWIRSILMPSVDIVIGNQLEMKVFRQIVATPTTPQQAFVTTKGENGAEFQTREQTIQVPARKPRILTNTVGAGDQFIAGLIYGLTEGFPVEQAMECGVRAATSILESIGARPPACQKTLQTEPFLDLQRPAIGLSRTDAPISSP